jgi:hypothetical protein
LVVEDLIALFHSSHAQIQNPFFLRLHFRPQPELMESIEVLLQRNAKFIPIKMRGTVLEIFFFTASLITCPTIFLRTNRNQI